MILIDPLGRMTSTVSEQELHEFAEFIGLERSKHYKMPWSDGWQSHYDLTAKALMTKAMINGAQIVSSRGMFNLSWWAHLNYRKQRLIDFGLLTKAKRILDEQEVPRHDRVIMLEDGIVVGGPKYG